MKLCYTLIVLASSSVLGCEPDASTSSAPPAARPKADPVEAAPDPKKSEDPAELEAEQRMGLLGLATTWGLSGVEGETSDALRAKVCPRLAKESARQDAASRATSIVANQVLYGCPDPGPFVPGPAGYWEQREKTSPVDGQVTAVASVESDPRLGPRHTVVVRCRAGVLEAYLLTPEFVTTQQLTYRFDADTPATVRVRESGNRDSLFFPRATLFTDQLLGKSTLALRYRTYNRGEREVTIDVRGAEVATARVRELCQAPRAKRSAVRGEVDQFMR